MKRNLENGRWFKVESEIQHSNLKAYGKLEKDDWSSDVQVGTYEGEGWYMMISYSKRCPRGCCYDTVYEVIPASQVAEELKEEMIKLADMLKEARNKV